MRNPRTHITEDVFNRVRQLQVVNAYPREGIMRETGLSRSSINAIRKAKTWTAWTEQKQATLAKRADKEPVLEPVVVTDDEVLTLLKTVHRDQYELHRELAQIRTLVNRVYQRTLADQDETVAAHLNLDYIRSTWLGRHLLKRAAKRAKAGGR